MATIFDVSGEAITDNEYQVRLLSMTLTLVKAAGGRIVIPPPAPSTGGMSYLYTDKLEDGTTILSVEDKPRFAPPTQETEHV
jgi:hypothetical protein